jgi:UDP-3-O-[3-hydroxymyristoyl] N-acetylglucosamine deacetylase
VSVSGIGLHSGSPVEVSLKPAKAGSGIIFRRTDLEQAAAQRGRRIRVEIPARLDQVSEVDHATTLSADTPVGSASVQTVEHLMAALSALAIDACVVEVDGPELPILDGSSRDWVALLQRAGRRTLPWQRPRLRIVAPKSVQVGDASIRVTPSDELRLTCSIDFPHESIGHQEISLAISASAFETDLAAARTFGFLHEVEQLRRAGLARGGSLDNAVVLDEGRVLNDDGLRFADEFVRHKALDLLGDLALIGCPLVGHVVAHRAGHRLHVAFARALVADASCWVLEGGAMADASAQARVASASRAPSLARAAAD